MKSVSLLLLQFLLFQILYAQVAPDKYWIRFTDKNNSNYSVDNPEAFLSQRAIDRRLRQNIKITGNDIPVNQWYIDSVRSTGVTLLTVSKWFNSVTVYTTDQNALNTINSFPFVQSVVKISGPTGQNAELLKPYFANETFYEKKTKEPVKAQTNIYDYGQALNQIQMLNGDSVHNAGYDGNGVVIAVLDAGFLNVDTLAAFDTLWDNGRILGWKDFVSPLSPNIFGSHSHGCMVLSTMGANLPGEMIGTAPKASYWLLRTEDAATEYIIEELNWASGAEFADSAGADIINSSLIYKTFDDPTLNHSYQDMDGNTAPITIAAGIAASKGIIVCNSAGNSGNSSTWPYIGAPADGDSVFTIGAVNGSGNYASFSSKGPTADGRLKPNVMAQGSGTTVISPWSGNVGTGSGTSFSSPITAGMMACLVQACPARTAMEIQQAVERSASQYLNPDTLMGYGIPDYFQALTALTQPDSMIFTLNLKVFLQGAFNGTDMNTGLSGGIIPLSQPYNVAPFNYQGNESAGSVPANITDWILIELRDTILPTQATDNSILARKAAFLRDDGQVVDLDGTSNLQFNVQVKHNLYIVVRHRNHLDLISKWNVDGTGGYVNYDFTTKGQAAGDLPETDLGNGVYGMIAGDSNGDGIIDQDDIVNSWSSQAGTAGYLSSDLNLDGQSNNSDKNDFWYINTGKHSCLPQ